MRKRLGMILKLLATGTFTLFIAACYGVAMEWKKITALSPEGTGVPDLNVTLRQDGTDVSTTTTDSLGSAEFAVTGPSGGLTVAIEDVDGVANGGQFQNAEISIDQRDEYTVNLAKE